MRGVIAIALLAILAFIIIAPFVIRSFGWTSLPDLEKLLTIIFAPIIGLVGAVTGFYYGERSAEQSAERSAERSASGTGTSRQP